ncbi:hypothetical protein ACET3X_003909 [Alternaria dauci]|uniref:J domain-containing protein n=1 Tax=Alternaria dauci TaxID=48095 RepID=A0ABR3ULF9_9PLEO
MPIETHYSILGISRAASTDEIEAAYRAILLANHPDKIKHLAPFPRTLAEARVRAAKIAYEVLIDEEKAKKYDEEMGIWGAFGNAQTWRRPWEPPVAPVDAGEDEPVDVEEDTSSRDGGSISFPTSPANEMPDGVLKAEYRYGLTRTATDIDVKIKGWKLYLLLSTKFHFLNAVTVIPTGSDTRTIAFQLQIQRNKTYRSTDEKVVELIVSVGYIPNGGRAVGNIQTVLKEVAKHSLTLTLHMTSVPSGKSPDTMPPWKFGFDFDMNGHPAAWGRQRGTCMIFTLDRQGVEEEPEDVLEKLEGLRVNRFCGLGDEKLMDVRYKTARMWRMVAVGYRKNDFLEG